MRMRHGAWGLLGLLVAADGPVSREMLASSLWPDSTDSAARANLRRHVHALIHALPPAEPAWIAGDARTIAWRRDGPARVDVLEFERLLELQRDDEAVQLY